MKTILLKTKAQVFGNLLGRHTSVFKGNGIDFKELREYIYGEDAKKIDWKITAKFNKPYVKEFEEEREINVIICVLASGTLHFGSKRLKSELISELTALIGYSAVKYDDKVSLVIYEKKPIMHFKPTKQINSIPIFIEYLENFDYLRKDYDFSFIDYLNKFQKSLLFLIGDFYKHPPLKNLKHETFVLWVRDKFEENPQEIGECDLINPINFKETHTSLNKKTVQKYKKELKKQDGEFINYLKKYKKRFDKFYTDEEVFYKFAELVK
jgi:uncharacterized protein (DUF58 family)